MASHGPTRHPLLVLTPPCGPGKPAANHRNGEQGDNHKSWESIPDDAIDPIHVTTAAQAIAKLPHTIPEIRRGGAYQLVGVTSDATELAHHIHEANQTTTPAEHATALAEALVLVRSAPFSDCAGEDFGWASHPDTPISAELTNQVLHAAEDLADLALAARDPTVAAWAVSQSWRVSPTEESLDERALHAATLFHPSRRARTWTTLTTRVINGERSNRPPPSSTQRRAPPPGRPLTSRLRCPASNLGFRFNR